MPDTCLVLLGDSSRTAASLNPRSWDRKFGLYLPRNADRQYLP